MKVPVVVRPDGSASRPDLAFSRALHYGDGVFRTLLRFEGELLDAEAQFDRLRDDASAIGLDMADFDPAALLEAVEAAADGSPRAVLKILAVRAGEGRGYAPQTDRAELLVYAFPAPTHPETFWLQGIEAEWWALTLADQPLLAGIKHLNRLEQVLAGRAMPADAQEMILGDGNGNAISGSRSNLFAVFDGCLCTPDLVRCGVRGHMRSRVLRTAASLDIPTRVEDLPWRELESATEVFVTNSLIGIWPLRRIGSQAYAAPGPLTTRIAQALAYPRLC